MGMSTDMATLTHEDRIKHTVHFLSLINRAKHDDDHATLLALALTSSDALEDLYHSLAIEGVGVTPEEAIRGRTPMAVNATKRLLASKNIDLLHVLMDICGDKTLASLGQLDTTHLIYARQNVALRRPTWSRFNESNT